MNFRRDLNGYTLLQKFDALFSIEKDIIENEDTRRRTLGEESDFSKIAESLSDQLGVVKQMWLVGFAGAIIGGFGAEYYLSGGKHFSWVRGSLYGLGIVGAGNAVGGYMMVTASKMLVDTVKEVDISGYMDKVRDAKDVVDTGTAWIDWIRTWSADIFLGSNFGIRTDFNM